MDHTVYIDPPADAFLQDLQASVPEWWEDGVRRVCLDFGSIPTLDSFETSLLTQLVLRASRVDITIKAANMSPSVQQAVALAGMGGLLGLPDLTPPRFDTSFS